MLVQPHIDTFFPVQGTAPSSLLPWILCNDSLTQKLKDHAGEARLQVLEERWVDSDWWDQQVLRLKRERVRHRNIVMWAENHPCWYARTVIPKPTFEAGNELFERLKTESLGDLLFSESSIQRSYLMHYAIDANSIEYDWVRPYVADSESQLWGRLSAYTVSSQFPFFVIEIVLPGLTRTLR